MQIQTVSTKTRLKFATLVALALPFTASAEDLFKVEVNGPAGVILEVGDSNVVDLVDRMSSYTEEFSFLSGQDFTGSLRFQGIPNAVSIDQQANGSGTLTFNLTGESYTYADSDDLEEFLKKNGAGIYARFLKEVGIRSATAPTDGNPRASTASNANENFTTFGMTPVAEMNFGEGTDAVSESNESKQLGGFGLGLNSGRFETEVSGVTYEGQFAEVGFAWLNLGLGDRVRLVAPFSASYLEIEGTTSYGIGQSLAVPIRLRSMDKASRWNWRLTPVGGANVRASLDAATGSVLWNAGLVNSIDYRVNRRLIVCLINQFTHYEGIPIQYSDYSFETEIEQNIIKNGVRLVTPLSMRKTAEGKPRLTLDGYAIQTNFLEDAAVEDFLTFGTSLSWSATKRFNLTLGANYDVGDTSTGGEFKSYSIGLSSAWRW